jgi:glutamate-1-semialdehyde 2,1-aminomutase
MSKESAALFERAVKVIPGGVNSPVRAFGNVGGTPVFFKRGEGAYLYDEENKRYTDYVGSWGPLILGHAHPKVIAKLHQALDSGLTFGAPTRLEVELAELINSIMPSMEMLRMVNSGTEATLSAIRLARGYTKKNKIIKFVGCYHGHHDSMLVKSGSGLLTFSLPDSAGIPLDFTRHTLTAPFNDLNYVQLLFAEYPNDIAAIIVEPIMGNMNMILPDTGFLLGLRKICTDNNSLLIFDEVITGFRVALGGAQKIYNVIPDLTCLGKIIGGGLPVGAFGGKKDIMQHLAPLGLVYQAGTLSGNPIAMTAGLATLRELQKCNYAYLEKLGKQLSLGLVQLADTNNINLISCCVGGLFGIKFIDDEKNLLFKQFFHAMLQYGQYFAPSPFEAGFMSFLHTEAIIEATLAAAGEVLERIASANAQ